MRKLRRDRQQEQQRPGRLAAGHPDRVLHPHAGCGNAHEHELEGVTVEVKRFGQLHCN